MAGSVTTNVFGQAKMWIAIFLAFGLFGPIAFAENADAPLLQELWMPKNLAENRTVKLNCNLIQGVQPLVFDWFLNDQKLEPNSRRRIVINEESSELVIKSLSVEEIGEIQCTVKNNFGQDSQKGFLLFNGK